MIRFTPGPWAICMDPPNTYWNKGRTIGAADPKDARRVCDVFSIGEPEPGSMWEANARLIAAAPDLLAAAHEFLGAIEDEYQMERDSDDDFIYDTLGSSMAAAYFSARAAIAKATGEPK